jgi:hypothetical protein
MIKDDGAGRDRSATFGLLWRSEIQEMFPMVWFGSFSGRHDRNRLYAGLRRRERPALLADREGAARPP